MLPREILETCRKMATDLKVDPDLVATEYEKVLRSHRLEKLDETTRQQEAMKVLQDRLLARLQIRKFRKGRHEPIE